MPLYGSGGAGPIFLQEALGIPETLWDATVAIPFPYPLGAAVNAVFSGACTTALVVHSLFRVGESRSASSDPFRARWAPNMSGLRRPAAGSDGYAAFASRYMHDYGAKKEDFGLVAINERCQRVAQPARRDAGADLHGRLPERGMIRWPLGLLDMDVPIDGADAVVVTTAERARATS